MKKNYYYNGVKIRTSNNDYTHAVLRIYEGGKIGVVACCGRYELAVKRLNQEINEYEKEIKVCKELIDDIKNNRYYDWGYDKFHHYGKHLITDKVKLEYWLEIYEHDLKMYEIRLNALQIAELEVRD